MLATNVGDVLTLDVVKQLWRAYKQRTAATTAVWHHRRPQHHQHVLIDDGRSRQVFEVQCHNICRITN